MNPLKYNGTSVVKIKITAVSIVAIISVTILTIFFSNEGTERQRIAVIQEMVKNGANPIVAACSISPYDSMGKTRPECLNK